MRQIIIFTLLAMVGVPLEPLNQPRAGESQVAPPRSRQETRTDWSSSADGKLSLRLSAQSNRVDQRTIWVVLAELKNKSDQRLTLKRPFSQVSQVKLFELQIRGPHGRVFYARNIPSAQKRTALDFADVAPGETLKDQLEITSGDFPGIVLPGTYQFDYRYRIKAGEIPDSKQGGQSVWTGKEFASHSLKLTKKVLDKPPSDWVETKWKDSQDKMLSFRLFSPPRFFCEESINVFGELRNNSKQRLFVKKPFGFYDHHIQRTKLVGPKGRLSCEILHSIYNWTPGPYIVLEPGQVFRDQLSIPVNLFPGSDVAGSYTITDGYRMTSRDAKAAARDRSAFWKTFASAHGVFIWAGPPIEEVSITVSKKPRR